MKTCKYLFIDRDGTLIKEPKDKQIDRIEKLEFLSGVFTALKTLIENGYKLVMVSNQDGLGTSSLPQADFDAPQELMLKIFSSQGIKFEDILICPHLAADNCDCRKPKVGLLMDYLRQQIIDRGNSYVIGDRKSDQQLANNLGIPSIIFDQENYSSWDKISAYIINRPRIANIKRRTNETNIELYVNLDDSSNTNIDSGIKFFDHMLEQFAKQSDIGLKLKANGDLQVDEHHTVEDIAIVIGNGISEALSDKIGIARYGFTLPMDESLCSISIDLSGRATCCFNAEFNRVQIGSLSTEMVSHFFSTLADSLGASMHVDIKGENTHHMIESAFKCLGRVLRQAIKKEGLALPSTKGIL